MLNELNSSNGFGPMAIYTAPWLLSMAITVILAFWRSQRSEEGTASFELAWSWCASLTSKIPFIGWDFGRELLRPVKSPYRKIVSGAEAAQIDLLREQIAEAKEAGDHDLQHSLLNELKQRGQDQEDGNERRVGTIVAGTSMFVVALIAAPLLYVTGYGLKYDVLSEMLTSPFMLDIAGMRLNPVAAVVSIGMLAIEIVLGAFLAWGITLWGKDQRAGSVAAWVVFGSATVLLIVVEGYLGVYRSHLQELVSQQESPLAWHVLISTLVPFATVTDALAIKLLLPQMGTISRDAARGIAGLCVLTFGLALYAVGTAFVGYFALMGMLMAVVALGVVEFVAWSFIKLLELIWIVGKYVFRFLGWIWSVISDGARTTASWTSTQFRSGLRIIQGGRSTTRSTVPDPEQSTDTHVPGVPPRQAVLQKKSS